MKKMKFAAAVKDFFGFKDNETLSGFMSEMKELTPEDRVELKEELSKEGYEIIES
jgi:hypothetical protein